MCISVHHNLALSRSRYVYQCAPDILYMCICVHDNLALSHSQHMYLCTQQLGVKSFSTHVSVYNTRQPGVKPFSICVFVYTTTWSSAILYTYICVHDNLALSRSLYMYLCTIQPGVKLFSICVLVYTTILH